jgi:hypothetical protein
MQALIALGDQFISNVSARYKSFLKSIEAILPVAFNLQFLSISAGCHAGGTIADTLLMNNGST